MQIACFVSHNMFSFVRIEKNICIFERKIVAKETSIKSDKKEENKHIHSNNKRW